MNETEDIAELITGSQRRLYCYVYSLIGNRSASWDVLQNTNMILWKKKDEFQMGSNFLAWAQTIARFQTMAFLRDRKREKTSVLTPEILELMGEEVEEEAEMYDKRRGALSTCLERLNPKSATMVKLHYDEDRSLQQIGETFGLSANAVKQSLFRARRALERCIASKTT